MSNPGDKALIKYKAEEKKFWNSSQNLNVYNLFVQGKAIVDIAGTLKMRPVTVEKIITRSFFVKRLEHHLRGVMFTTQVAQILAKDNIFSKLWERVRDNIEDIPPEICLKELTKLFPQKKDGLIINPKNMNIFMKVMQDTPPEKLGERLEEIEDDFGFEGLDEDDKAKYPELEGPKDDGIKQGDPEVDQTKTNKDE
jgi:hypothetical protein